MPRAAVNTTEEKKVAPKKTRKKAPAKKSTARSGAAKSTTARTTKKQVTVKSPGVEGIRKAPTQFSTQAKQQKAKRMQIAVVVGLMIVGIGASAAVGFTDSGTIDVAQTIQDRNARIANMVDVNGPTIVGTAPINAGIPGVADGGLIGLQPSAPVAPLLTAEELASSTATSTSVISAVDDASTTDTLPEVDNVITYSATTTVVASSSVEQEAVE